jgi:hypothetical protein
LNEHDLQAKRTLFIDDKKENTDLLLLGLQVWNLQVGKEDVVDLFNKTYYRNRFWKLKTPTIPSNLREEILYKEKNSKFSVLPIPFNRKTK